MRLGQAAYRLIVVMVLLLLGAAACSSDKGYVYTPPQPTPVVAAIPTGLPPYTSAPSRTPLPTLTRGPSVVYTPEMGMYIAAAEAFFNDRDVHNMVRPDLLSHRVVYIKVSGSTLQDEVTRLVASRVGELDLVPVAQDTPDGATISVGAVKSDPESTLLVHGKEGPTLSMTISRNGVPCGGVVSIGYLLTKTDSGWKAEQYVQGMC